MNIEQGLGVAGWINAILISLAIWCAIVVGLALI